MGKKTLWEMLWDFDPNCLFVVDEQMIIRVLNPAFCSTFQTDADITLGKNAALFFDDLSDFHNSWTENIVIHKEKTFPRYGTHMQLVIFPIKEEGLIACIMVNLTQEYHQKEELARMREELYVNVNQVIDKQMSIAQEIASLLGETTAEAKVGLLKIRNMMNEEN